MLKEQISIIVPVYNAEKYLNECVDSLINQDYENIEIILVDDGSRDSSPSICDEYAKKDKRIKVIHKKNAGVSATRNDGIKIANGEWITFVDADDWVETNYISSMYNVIDSNTDMIIGRTIAVNNGVELNDGYRGKNIDNFSNEEKKLLFKSIFNDNLKLMKYPHISTCSAKLIRKNLIIENNIWYDTNLKYYEDAIFNIEVICLSKEVKLINEKIYKYRLNNDSSTNTFDSNTLDNYEKVYDMFDKISKKYQLDFDEYKDVFKIKNLNTILSNYMKDKRKTRDSIKFIYKICNSESYRRSLKNVKLNLLPQRRKLLVISYRIKFYFIMILLYRI